MIRTFLRKNRWPLWLVGLIAFVTTAAFVAPVWVIPFGLSWPQPPVAAWSLFFILASTVVAATYAAPSLVQHQRRRNAAARQPLPAPSPRAVPRSSWPPYTY